MTEPAAKAELPGGLLLAIYARREAEKAGAIKASWAWGALLEWSEPLQRHLVKMTRPFATLDDATDWMFEVKAGRLTFFESPEKPPVEPVFK